MHNSLPTILPTTVPLTSPRAKLVKTSFFDGLLGTNPSISASRLASSRLQRFLNFNHIFLIVKFFILGIDENGYEVYEEVDECSIVPESTLLTLTISYDLPQAGVILLESLGPKGQEFIQQTLLNDLKRFRTRLVRDLRDERMASFRLSQINRNSKKKVEL